MKIFLFVAGELKWINEMKDRTWTDWGISRYKQCCGTVTIYYGSGSGSDF